MLDGPADEHAPTALERRPAAGARIGLFVSPAATVLHGDLLDAVCGLSVGGPVLDASLTNPLVATTDALIVGAGPLDGLRLTVDNAVSLEGDGVVPRQPPATTPRSWWPHRASGASSSSWAPSAR